MNQQETTDLFNKIVKDYSERLYWHVRDMVGSHDDANDLLQEIFIKIWTALPSFRGDAQLFTWAHRIATNETLNFLRKQKIRSVLSFEKISGAEERIADDPYFNGGEAERLLVNAMNKLPPKQRAVFSMRYYDDMKYEDIAQIMNCSVGSLKASYHIAYLKIKEELKKFSTDF